MSAHLHLPHGATAIPGVDFLRRFRSAATLELLTGRRERSTPALPAAPLGRFDRSPRREPGREAAAVDAWASPTRWHTRYTP